MNDRHALVIELYNGEQSNLAILNATGYCSITTIYNILDKYGVVTRKNCARNSLDEQAIVGEWKTNIVATTRSLGDVYGCSYGTIRAILHNHLSPSEMETIKSAKMSYSASQRKDTKTDVWREKARWASKHVDPKKRKQSILKAVRVSAQRRKGKPLSAEHRKKLSTLRIGMHAGSKHPNWKGGTSQIQWRGPGWNRARRMARERDNYTCQSCFVTEDELKRELDVHHIVSFFKFSDYRDANRIGNLVCLCHSCHMRVEAGNQECFSKSNRPTRDEFRCSVCGFVAPADWNAAVNIAAKANVNLPMVSTEVAKTDILVSNCATI